MSKKKLPTVRKKPANAWNTYRIPDISPGSRIDELGSPGTARPPTRHERLTTAAAIFGVALVVRLLHLWQIHRAPFFPLKLGDAATYDAWARDIESGAWLGRSTFYQAPLYPYLLALVYAVSGRSVLTVRLFEALLSAGACALLGDAGWRFFSKRTGVIAGVMLASYPPAVFLDTLLQKSAVDTFCLCLVLWLVSRFAQEPRRSTSWQLGFALGCLALTRENAGLLVAPVLAWVVFQPSLSGRARLALGGLMVAGVITALGPVALRNQIVGGEFVITTAQFGPNLYIGNNAQSDGTYRSLRPLRGKATYERQDATDLAEQALGRALTPGDVSAYYTHRVLEFVRDHPADYFRLLLRKFLLVWNVMEITDTEDQYTYAEWSSPAALGSVWNLGVLAPLGTLGLWITARMWRRLWILYLMLATYVASVVIFYVFARYRFPIVPFMMLFAAAGLDGVGAFLSLRDWLQLAGCAAAMIGAAAVSNLPLVPKNKLEATTRFNFGVGLEAAGHQDEAIREYQEATRQDFGMAAAHDALGLLLGKRERLAEASEEFQDVVRLSPADPKAYNNLGVVLARQGKLMEAKSSLEESVRLDATYAEARRNLASLLAALADQFTRTGGTGGAVDALREAIQMAPERADLHNNLGILLASQGDRNGAAAEFDRALALDPENGQARRNLDRMRQRP